MVMGVWWRRGRGGGELYWLGLGRRVVERERGDRETRVSTDASNNTHRSYANYGYEVKGGESFWCGVRVERPRTPPLSAEDERRMRAEIEADAQAAAEAAAMAAALGGGGGGGVVGGASALGMAAFGADPRQGGMNGGYAPPPGHQQRYDSRGGPPPPLAPAPVMPMQQRGGYPPPAAQVGGSSGDRYSQNQQYESRDGGDDRYAPTPPRRQDRYDDVSQDAA